jgi:hypothetical protein
MQVLCKQILAGGVVQVVDHPLASPQSPEFKLQYQQKQKTNTTISLLPQKQTDLRWVTLGEKY